MRNLILLILTATFLSCGAKKLVTSKEKRFEGNWYLEKITYNTDANYNVTLFNDASKYCFEGSSWKFLRDNKSGNYVVNKTSCETKVRDFKYEIGNKDTATGFYNLILTPINGNTSKSYNLLLKDLDMTSMKWTESRTIDGVEFTIEMKFKKFD
ncbi:lipocalin [Polaribacter vadi]|uniref:lipocalin n=1 Tax=Polaribacter vadi TaxID=1774273 RepID=UPI0030EEB784|tara:strand:+ start:3198 stop:3659 length:462 start_codon:yes stop_codon:yes gene_type:complete